MSGKSKTYNFTSRKKSFGNYWLVYSNKTGVILKLVSDREVAHWILNLEFNPNVQTFKFDDFSTNILIDGLMHDIKYRALVQYSCGLEYQFISVEKNDLAKSREKSIDAALWRATHIKFRHISDEDLVPRRHHVFPLLRLSAFLTANKDQFISPGLIDGVDAYIGKMRRGIVAKYLTDMGDFSKSALMLQLYRLYNSGVIALSFVETPFMYGSLWELRHE
ncbi:hypothetical protein SOP85_01845 [Pseudomonas sp. YuFO20]|uniref:hypothetical protein n=1 Tax=Pseudomonas sp. YuFO20 TaxID=3095362 RepID=UPI002B255F64|nr:hypothetical protein [Pseudomonas sp. YuFO20]MEB2514184.1 hypothetical protein [Pseudomonas sp. YuFO20]